MPLYELPTILFMTSYINRIQNSSLKGGVITHTRQGKSFIISLVNGICG